MINVTFTVMARYQEKDKLRKMTVNTDGETLEDAIKDITKANNRVFCEWKNLKPTKIYNDQGKRIMEVM